MKLSNKVYTRSSGIAQQTKSPPIAFFPIGLALVVISYLMAGGNYRFIPMYDMEYGCKYEWLGCLPLYYLLLYPLAILGVCMCGWALVTSILRLDQIGEDGCLNSLVVLLTSVLMILAGVWILDLHISFAFGGSSSGSDDIYGVIALVLVVMAPVVGGVGFFSLPRSFRE